ncbi:MAG: helix-turn-helix domain-containing protein [Halioglobus sp.]
MSEQPQDKAQLPLIRLNLAQAFLDATLTAGVDADQILAPYGLNVQAFANPDMFLPAPTMYDVVEALSEATGDPFIGVHLGTQLDPFQWSPLARAAILAQSVGDLLLRFSIDAQKDANSAVFRLETRGQRASFSEGRLSDGGRIPRHNDGFGAAYVLSILRSATGAAWDGKQVLVSVCDPAVFPSDYLGIHLAHSSTQGFTVAFPCEWLLLPPQLKNQSEQVQLQVNDSEAARTPMDALHHVLLANLHDPKLNAERVASLCGVSKRTLARRLEKMGSSLKTEIDMLRQKRVETELLKGNRSVAAIGASVGYPDSTVFIRAFKRWTGTTPRRFRDSQS